MYDKQDSMVIQFSQFSLSSYVNISSKFYGENDLDKFLWWGR